MAGRALEEGHERGLGADGYDALFVEPDALEDEREELALGDGVGLAAPEDREVFEHLSGLVEVGYGLRGEGGEFAVGRVASCHVLGAVEVAQLVEVARTAQALFQGCAPLADLGGVIAAGAGETAEDLLASGLGRLEVGHELDELRLDAVGVDERLVAVVGRAAVGAVVAGGELAPDGGAVHLALAALVGRQTAQQVARGWPSRMKRAGAVAAHELHAVEQCLFDDRLMQALDGLARVAAP